MKSVRLLCLTILLITALILPAAVYASEPETTPGSANMEILTKVGTKGASLRGPLSRCSKSGAASGIIGEEVDGTRYAILVGISDYPGPYHVLEGGYDLCYAAADAQVLKDTLIFNYGFEEDNINLLLDSEASRYNILNEIANMKSIVSKNDEVVFFFSGHGAKRKPKPNPAKEGGKVGIVTWGWENPEAPTEFYMEAIWDKELKEAFKKFKTDRLVFIFDCCLADGMIDLGKKGRIVCMATSQNGMAAEYGEYYGPPIAGLGPVNHGLFTYLLIELGMMYQLADFNAPDGLVTVEEAYDFARAGLDEMSNQFPEFWQIPSIEDDFKKDLLL